MRTMANSQQELINKAVFGECGSNGVYARTALFEQVINGLSRVITRHREPNTEVLRFPPVMSRAQLERSGYLQSFPHLLGAVSCLGGDEAKVRALVERPDWPTQLSPTELVLSPAACYPVFLLPPRSHARIGSLSVFPDARVCLHRGAGHGAGFSQALDHAGRGPRQATWSGLYHRQCERPPPRPGSEA